MFFMFVGQSFQEISIEMSTMCMHVFTSPNRFFTKVVLTDFDCAGGGDLATQLDTLFLEIKEFRRANPFPFA